MTRPPYALLAASLMVSVAALAGGCQSAPRPSTVIQLEAQNDSGVTWTLTLTDLGDGRTQVGVAVEPRGNLDMPAHIHPGTCDAMIPQPLHPLTNVVNGVSTTIVPATLQELTGGGLAANLHRSNEDLRTSTACADL
jgi:hypothetical protein